MKVYSKPFPEFLVTSVNNVIPPTNFSVDIVSVVEGAFAKDEVLSS
jgi:hypothetical protein